MPGWADDHEWTDAVPVVMTSARYTLIDGRTHEVLGTVTYDDAHDGVCNASHMGGDVCRLPLDHEGRHLRCSGELVATTGFRVLTLTRPL